MLPLAVPALSIEHRAFLLLIIRRSVLFNSPATCARFQMETVVFFVLFEVEQVPLRKIREITLYRADVSLPLSLSVRSGDAEDGERESEIKYI